MSDVNIVQRFFEDSITNQHNSLSESISEGARQTEEVEEKESIEDMLRSLKPFEHAFNNLFTEEEQSSYVLLAKSFENELTIEDFMGLIVRFGQDGSRDIGYALKDFNEGYYSFVNKHEEHISEIELKLQASRRGFSQLQQIENEEDDDFVFF